MATIQDLRALALQIRDADEDRENTALKVGQFLYDLLGYLDTKADLTTKGQWSKQLSFNQTPIVALQSVEAIPDSQGQNNKMWWSSDDGQLKWKANDEVYPLGNPTYILYYCGNKIYRWSGSTTGFVDMALAVINDLATGGGTVALSAEMGLKVRNKIDALNDRMNDLIGALAGIAFIGGKPAQTDINWGDAGVTHHTVTLDTTGLVDCSVVEQFPKTVADGEGVTITINPASGMSLASASYKIGSSGTPVNVNITNNAAVITLTNITADITVYVTAAASDTVIGIAYHNVRMAGKTENNINFAELVTGPAEPYSVSPLFDLGANRTESVDIFFTVGAVDTTCSILLFDSDKVYKGQVGANNASGRTYSCPSGLRFVRFCFKTQYKSAASMSIGNEEVFNGDTYDGVWGDYKDFRSSQFCPQPNANGDYVGWVPIYKGELYVTGRTAYGNIDNVNLSDARGASDQSWQTRIGSAAALASKAIPYTITKQLNIPASYKYTFRLTDANNLNPDTGMPFSCLQLYSEVNGVVSDMGKLTITTATTNNQDGSRTVNGNSFGGQTYSRLVIATSMYDAAYYHDDTTKSVAQDTNNEHYLWENFS